MLIFLICWPFVFLLFFVLCMVLVFVMMGVRWIRRRFLPRITAAVNISGLWAKMTYHLMLTPISPLFLRPLAFMRLFVFSRHVGSVPRRSWNHESRRHPESESVIAIAIAIGIGIE